MINSIFQKRPFYVEQEYGNDPVRVAVSDTQNMVLLVRSDLLDEKFLKQKKYDAYPDHSRIFNVSNFNHLEPQNRQKLIEMALAYGENNIENLALTNNVSFDMVLRFRSKNTFNKILEAFDVVDNDKFLAAFLSSSVVRPNIELRDFEKLLELPLENPGDLHNFRNFASEYHFVNADIDIPTFTNEQEFQNFHKFVDHISEDKVIDFNISVLLTKVLPVFKKFINIFECTGAYDVDKDLAFRVANLIDVYQDVPEFSNMYLSLAARGVTSFDTVKSLLTDEEYIKCSNIVDLVDSIIVENSKSSGYYSSYRKRGIVALFAYYFVTAIENDSLDVVYEIVSNCINDNSNFTNLLNNRILRDHISHLLNNYDHTPLDFYLEIEGVKWEAEKDSQMRIVRRN